MDAEVFNAELAKIADRFRPYMQHQDKNRNLLEYTFGYDKDIKVYYPHSRRLTPDASGYPYARVATMTVNAPMSAVTAMWYGDASANAAGDPSEWNPATVRDFRTVSLLPPPSLRIPEQGPGGILDKVNKAAAKRKTSQQRSGSSPSSSDSSGGSFVNPKNVQLCHETSLVGPYTSHFVSLTPREFYYWSVLSPAALVGVYDKYTSVCVLQMDASGPATTGAGARARARARKGKGDGSDKNKSAKQRSILLDNAAYNTIPAPSNAFGSFFLGGTGAVIRGRRNSALLLEAITPEKTKVTFAMELDPRMRLLAVTGNGADKAATASGNSTGGSDAVPLTAQLLQLWYMSDAHAFGNALRSMKTGVERQYASEDQGLSVEEAARRQFKRQMGERERSSLSMNVAGTSAGIVSTLNSNAAPAAAAGTETGKRSASKVGDVAIGSVYSSEEAVADQQRLVSLLERRLQGLQQDQAELQTSASSRRNTGNKAQQAAAAAQYESDAAELASLRRRVEKDLAKATSHLHALKAAQAEAAGAGR